MRIRQFPSYTTAQLKAAADEGQTSLRTPELLAKIKQEIADRESGVSIRRVTPVVPWT